MGLAMDAARSSNVIDSRISDSRADGFDSSDVISSMASCAAGLGLGVSACTLDGGDAVLLIEAPSCGAVM